MKNNGLIILILCCAAFVLISADVYDDVDVIIGVVHFQGGGDWYSCITAVRNQLSFISRETPLQVSLKEKVVKITDDDLFLYPYIVINGHGDLLFDSKEAERLKLYLENGGFLFVNDDYGLEPFIRREMKKVFPDKQFVEVPFDHPIYHSYYDFPDGLPKIHEHDGGPPIGYGIFINGRLVCFYALNTDIMDGWEKEEVYGNPEELRTAAHRMGVNILYYALTH